jgi:hypothetical protein
MGWTVSCRRIKEESNVRRKSNEGLSHCEACNSSRVRGYISSLSKGINIEI